MFFYFIDYKNLNRFINTKKSDLVLDLLSAKALLLLLSNRLFLKKN